MWQSGDQINIQVRDAGDAQACNIVEHLIARVHTADRPRFAVNKRLYAKTHTINATTNQGFEHFRGKGCGRTLNRNLGIGGNFKVLAQRTEYLLYLRRIQNAGRTSTQIDRVHLGFPPAAVHLDHTPCRSDVLRQAIDVALHARARKHVGGEVAVTALRLAKRDRNVNTKRHCR